jgi:creatinine amidohydrolase
MGVFLSELTWEEAEKAFRQTQTIMVPTGSTEQHGPHMPVGTDWIAAEGLAKLVTAKADVITTQVIPIGFAEYHMDFPGTLTVTREHLTNYLVDICESLVRWGAKRFVFLNGHGGNAESLDQVAIALRRKYGLISAIIHWWEVVPEVDGHPSEQHGGYAETAVVAALRPELVKYDRAKLGVTAPLTQNIRTAGITTLDFKGVRVRTFLRTKDVSKVGSMTEQLDPKTVDLRLATPQVGLRILESAADRIAEFIAEFQKVKLYEPVE